MSTTVDASGVPDDLDFDGVPDHLDFADLNFYFDPNANIVCCPGSVRTTCVMAESLSNKAPKRLLNIEVPGLSG